MEILCLTAECCWAPTALHRVSAHQRWTGSGLPTSTQHQVLSVSEDAGPRSRSAVASHRGFISLVTDNVEPLYMCLLAICLSLLEK